MNKIKNKSTIIEKVVLEQEPDMSKCNSLGTILAHRSCKVTTVEREIVRSRTCSHTSVQCPGCPACSFERHGCGNKDRPFDVDLVTQLSSREPKDVKKPSEQAATADVDVVRTPKCRGRINKHAPTYTKTFFVNVICRYQVPKRGLVSKPSKILKQSAKTRNVSMFNDTHCREVLKEFIDKMPKTTSEERHQYMMQRWSEQINKNKATKLMTNEDREFFFVKTAMESFWAKDADKLIKNIKKFRIKKPEDLQKLLKFTPGTHWLDILQSNVLVTENGRYSQFHQHLKTLIALWRSSRSRLFMKDINHPGLIESCAERKMNFNNVTSGMLLSIFGLIPETPGPFQPVTLLEVYTDRLDYESRRLRKHEEQYNLQDGVDDYFQRKCKTNLNLAIKAYLRAKKLIYNELLAKQQQQQRHKCSSKVKKGPPEENKDAQQTH